MLSLQLRQSPASDRECVNINSWNAPQPRLFVPFAPISGLHRGPPSPSRHLQNSALAPTMATFSFFITFSPRVTQSFWCFPFRLLLRSSSTRGCSALLPHPHPRGNRDGESRLQPPGNPDNPRAPATVPIVSCQQFRLRPAYKRRNTTRPQPRPFVA